MLTLTIFFLILLELLAKYYHLVPKITHQITLFRNLLLSVGNGEKLDGAVVGRHLVHWPRTQALSKKYANVAELAGRSSSQFSAVVFQFCFEMRIFKMASLLVCDL